MNVFILGGTGFIGTPLARRLAEEGHNVAVLHRGQTAADLPAGVVSLQGDRQRRFFSYLKRMDDGRRALLLSEEEAAWRWTHGYVENVAAAIACAATDERAAGRTYNVGPTETPTQAGQVRRLGEAVGWSGEVVALRAERLPEALKSGFDFRYDLTLDTRRLREELGFAAPVPPGEALRRTAQWQRAHPPAEAPPLDYALLLTGAGRRSRRRYGEVL